MSNRITLLVMSVLLAFAACATAPSSHEDRQSLQASAQTSLDAMRSRDPGLSDMLAHSVGYVVIPEIAKGGLGFGGAWGRGVLYEHGTPAGYVQLSQGSWGLQAGGQTFSELIVIQDPGALDRLKSGQFTIGGNASAVAVTTGAAATARFTNGLAVFAMPRAGLMAELSVSGQQLSYSRG
jgi:lipid-binding SYLF domain-containing protein